MKISKHANGSMQVGCGMLIWYLDIAYGSKLLNLESFNPCQPVELNASMKKDTWMDQNNETVAQCLSTTNTEHVKAKSLNSTYSGVSFAQERCVNLIPIAPCFAALCSLPLHARCLVYTSQAVFHSIRVPEKGTLHDPQHLSCLN